MSELVSIIVPLYNKEKFVYRALTSLKSQTYSNIEVIIVDDGSTDSGGKICKRFCEKDIRFRYIYQNNKGVSVARNRGIDSSLGEWIMFVDPDDYVLDNCVDELMNKISETVDIVSCSCYCEKEDRIENSFFDTYREFLGENKEELFFQLLDPNYKSTRHRETAIGVPWGKIYRSEFLKREGLQFDSKLVRMQDNIFNMYAFEKARKIIYINKPLYVYNLQNILCVNNKYDKRAVEYYTEIIKLRREFFDYKYKKEVMKEEFFILEIMLSKYFFNLSNCERITTKVKCLKKYIEDNEIDNTLKSIKYCDLLNKKEKIILYLLKTRQYYLLGAVSYIFFKIKVLMVKKNE